MRESEKAKALTMREVWSSALSVASITMLSAAITQVAVLHNNGLRGAVGQYCFNGLGEAVGQYCFLLLEGLWVNTASTVWEGLWVKTASCFFHVTTTARVEAQRLQTLNPRPQTHWICFACSLSSSSRTLNPKHKTLDPKLTGFASRARSAPPPPPLPWPAC